MNRYLLLSVILSIITTFQTMAQDFRWKTGFYSFFDNKEYFNDYVDPQSILGARIFAETGFVLDDKNEFGAGANYMFEFGSEPSVKYINPILYYHHKDVKSELYMGAFPRRGLYKLPRVLQNDTFNYYRPNIEGIYFSINKPWGSQNVWLDWTSKQTIENRETFLIGATGYLKKGISYIRYDFLMNHYAGTAEEGSFSIRDNGGLVAVAGLNLSSHTFLDSLNINTGMASSYDRFRTFYELRYYYGSLSEVYVGHKAYGVRSTFYIGDGQIIMAGDKMYSAHFYNRTDLIWNFYRKKRVKGFFEFSLHFLPEVTDVSQKFAVYIDIGGQKKIKDHL